MRDEVETGKGTVDLTETKQYFSGFDGKFRQHPGQDIVQPLDALLNHRQLVAETISRDITLPSLPDRPGCVSRPLQNEYVVDSTFMPKWCDLNVDETTIAVGPFKADPEDPLFLHLTKDAAIGA